MKVWCSESPAFGNTQTVERTPFDEINSFVEYYYYLLNLLNPQWISLMSRKTCQMNLAVKSLLSMRCNSVLRPR